MILPLQTHEEFSQFYLAAPLDASEFSRSGEVHQAPEREVDDGDGSDSESNNIGSSGLDWRNKGYVTSVRGSLEMYSVILLSLSFNC